MKQQTVHLGFEVPSGKPVDIPVAHLVVTGMTQLSGKTTTLEALIFRSNLKAIAFLTKRGESAFGPLATTLHDRNVLQPYFRHRADWQFVSDILGAILSEKLKFQRPWIMKLCRGAKTLREVANRIPLYLHGDKKKKMSAARGIAEGVYTELDEYFQLLLPEIERLLYTDKLELRPGLNVMDLSSYSTALQMLVIAATIDRINEKESGIVVVIPEAWEFVPNGRNSPVKRAAISLARKGAGIQNFMWLDSQDLASIDTEVRRACSVWILGVQREQNEVKRTLSHITDAPKPKVDDIMQLERGQFFVCHGREVKKVYVQPAWMSEKMAKDISQGKEPTTEFTIRRVKAEHAGTPQVSRPHGATLVRESELTVRLPPDYIVAPDNTPKQSDYMTMPAGLNHFIDDGGKDVDQQERERYEQRITELTTEIQDLRKRLGAVPVPDNYGEMKKPVAAHRTSLTIPEIGRGLLHDESFTRAVKAMIPSNGRVIVEPREYHLKQFCQGEVNRIMAQVNDLSVWQSQVLIFLTAKGALMQKSEILRALTGKNADQTGGTYKDKYNEIDQLTAMGFLENRGARWGSRIRDTVKERLSVFEATDEDTEQTVATILANLK